MLKSNQKIRVPIPTDSYDQISCDQATITSIKMLITTFDTSMDSIHESIDKLMNRLDKIQKRTEKIQRRILEQNSKMDHYQQQEQRDFMKDKDEQEKDESKQKMNIVAKVSYPSLYDHATRMNHITSSLYRTSSAITMAKQKANDAIKRLLLEELNNDGDDNGDGDNKDGKESYEVASTTASSSSSSSSSSTQPMEHHKAKPSDEWLDRVSAFEERSNAKMAMQIHTIPPLIISNNSSVQMMESALHINLKHTLDNNKNSSSSVDCKDEIKMKILMEETAYYKNGLEDIQDERYYSEKKSTNTNTNAVIFDKSSMKLQQHQQHSTTTNSLTLDYYDDNMSVISDYSRGAAAIGNAGGIYGGDVGATPSGGGGESHTIVSSYSTVSHGASSASRRRRQRKIMALAEAATSPSRRERIIKDSHILDHVHQQRHTMSSSKSVSSSNNNTSLIASIASSRQQALSGSIPYVCDLVHDSFGLIDGRFDNVYSSETTVNEMLIDNYGVGKPELKMNVFASDSLQKDSSTEKITPKHGSSMKFKIKPPLNVLSEEEDEKE